MIVKLISKLRKMRESNNQGILQASQQQYDNFEQEDPVDGEAQYIFDKIIQQRFDEIEDDDEDINDDMPPFHSEEGDD